MSEGIARHIVCACVSSVSVTWIYKQEGESIYVYIYGIQIQYKSDRIAKLIGLCLYFHLSLSIRTVLKYILAIHHLSSSV